MTPEHRLWTAIAKALVLVRDVREGIATARQVAELWDEYDRLARMRPKGRLGDLRNLVAMAQAMRKARPWSALGHCEDLTLGLQSCNLRCRFVVSDLPPVASGPSLFDGGLLE